MMAGLRGALILLAIFIISCSATPKRRRRKTTWVPRTTTPMPWTTTPMPRTTTNMPWTTTTFDGPFYDIGDMVDEDDDQCPFTRAEPLYDEVSNVAHAILHPDYQLLYNYLFMSFKGTYTEVRYKNIKAGLESNPITIFSNLTMHKTTYNYNNLYRNSQLTYPKLGELISDLIIETYSKMALTIRKPFHLPDYKKIRNPSPPLDLTKTEAFAYDKSKWTKPWLKEKLVRGLVAAAHALQTGGSGRRLTAEGQALLQGNDVENVLKAIGELANNMIHSNLNLESLTYLKQSILSEFRRLPFRQLSEENINKAVDCWYETDGVFHIEEGAEENILLLQAMIEVVPKDTVKEVFRSWRTLAENANDLEVSLDKIVRVVDQKIQEFDVPRMINLFKVHMENVIQYMQRDNIGGRNLFQRVQKLNKMIDKAIWRMGSGLWPEIINFLDRLVLSLKTKDINENGLTLWKDLDNLMTSIYHEIKTECYQNSLVKEFFPTSKIQLGTMHRDFWQTQFARSNMMSFKGQLRPALYNVFVNPQFNFLEEVLKFTRKINVVELEKLIDEKLNYAIYYVIKTSIGWPISGTHWTLRDGLAALERKGFPSDLLMEDWEKMPRELEAFLEVDWQTYFVYFVHAIAETYIDFVERVPLG